MKCTHTLEQRPNGDWRLTFQRDPEDYAEFETREGAVGYLKNINEIFGTNFKIERKTRREKS